MLSFQKRCMVGEVNLINNKSWFSSASKFEKIFWGTILLFLFIFIILHFFASREFYQSNNKNYNSSKTIIREIDLVVNSNKMRLNLENNQSIKIIRDDLEKQINDMNMSISSKTKELFAVANNNIDIFLDFHYSVIGEYVELGNMAVGKIEEHIENRLFGEDFNIKMENMLNEISIDYQYNLKEHLKVMHTRAKIGVDSELNSGAIKYLEGDIHKHFLLQQGKLATIIMATITSKIIKMIATKLAVKEATIIGSKASTKVGIKSAAIISGVSAGTICGPLVWVCSPIAATVLWFGTDAIVVSVDEKLNRDKFKKEILSELSKQEINLTKRLQSHYSDAMISFSNQAILKYKEAPIKEKKRMTIREIMSE